MYKKCSGEKEQLHLLPLVKDKEMNPVKICSERHHKKWKEERLWICYNQYRTK